MLFSASLLTCVTRVTCFNGTRNAKQWKLALKGGGLSRCLFQPPGVIYLDTGAFQALSHLFGVLMETMGFDIQRKRLRLGGGTFRHK